MPVLDNNEIELNEDGSLFLVKLMNTFADVRNKIGRFNRFSTCVLRTDTCVCHLISR